MIAFFDTNVALDVMLGRVGSTDASMRAWSFIERGGMPAFVSAFTFNSAFHIMRKHGPSAQRRAMESLQRVFRVAPVNQAVIDAAVANYVGDIEDEVQLQSALGVGANVIVTRASRVHAFRR